MATRYTDLDRLVLLYQTRSLRQVARELGVHHETVRRWLQGTNQITKNREQLVRAASRERTAITRRAKAEGYSPPSVAVQPPSHRMTRIDPRDPKHERLIYDESIAFDIAKTPTDDVLEILNEYRQRAIELGRPSDVRFLVRFTPTPDYPRGRKLTEPTSITGRTAPERILADARRQGAIFEMRVIDPELGETRERF